GADPAAMVAMLEGMGADAIGMNCSLGPKALRPVAEEYLKYASVPVLLKPNAGMPHVVDGKTVYDVLPDEFSCDVSDLIGKGVRIAGGCCGTTPDYIRALSEKTVGCKPVQIETEKLPCVSSYTHAVFFDKRPVLIGERINPTGKKRFKEALRNREMDYILKEGLAQQEKGVDILDVNVGLPEIDEVAMLTDSVRELQAVTDLPLQIDSSDPVAMEAALRRYNGKAMINSVNGKKESMETIFPLAKKYGGLIVALTLDEGGIPATADGRVAVARKILETARQYGLDRRDLIFDPLAMTVSADQNAARETLNAVERIRKELGCCVSLGVSNVSFGLPRRDLINGTFLTMAMTKGLSAAIMNPYSDEMMKSFFTFNALSGLDDNCGAYIEYVETLPQPVEGAAVAVQKKAETKEYPALQHAIIKGLKDRAAALTVERLQTENPLDIVQNEIIPALDTVGHGFEQKTVYLPQLLMSAEAANSAFEKIKAAIPQQSAGGKCSVVIATVQGDIHDIGKNIVKLLLENYGFAVTDLGKDVAPETIVEEVVRQHAPLVGLSALMTTTVPAMAETVALLHAKAPWCKTVVGGAVLTEEYAASIHADKYAKDAMETVRYAEEINAIIKKRSD
ncbi:MAG: dihydropteroate synthase, partial [Clostridia bacterium]|nr:dihydropteroate synthase [Clostridia bacterium]